MGIGSVRKNVYNPSNRVNRQDNQNEERNEDNKNDQDQNEQELEDEFFGSGSGHPQSAQDGASVSFLDNTVSVSVEQVCPKQMIKSQEVDTKVVSKKKRRGRGKSKGFWAWLVGR